MQHRTCTLLPMTSSRTNEYNHRVLPKLKNQSRNFNICRTKRSVRETAEFQVASPEEIDSNFTEVIFLLGETRMRTVLVLIFGGLSHITSLTLLFSLHIAILSLILTEGRIYGQVLR